ncbi:hypothetical protein QFZ36_000193 [Pseudarthrobacter siccitolerans]|uniref:Uncharacterized protein n=1 Tax=Pseudarthrobacter siccitolerans TaxID=861266 RepID=A0ABU0PGE3_9MICC|nr:hypothetical protein [Pseudarthrobacter siccitolerans]
MFLANGDLPIGSTKAGCSDDVQPGRRHVRCFAKPPEGPVQWPSSISRIGSGDSLRILSSSAQFFASCSRTCKLEYGRGDDAAGFGSTAGYRTSRLVCHHGAGPTPNLWEKGRFFFCRVLNLAVGWEGNVRKWASSRGAVFLPLKTL